MSSVLLSVMVIEDDGDIRDVLVDALQLDGFIVRAFASAEEALHVLRAEPHPRVILLDLNLPRVDGVTLLERLGEIAEHEDAFRVLIFSADPLANDLRGRRFVAGVLPKPCKLAHLLFAVRQAAMPANTTPHPLE